jgi:DNA-binding LacI/PurR family transcriptional regulator
MAAAKASRGSAGLVESIRGAIETGVYGPGQFVPSARELSGTYGVSAETVRRGLKLLEREGLLAAEPRQGFRVVKVSVSSIADLPVAYVTDYSFDLKNAQPTNWAISSTLQEAAGRRGWTTLGAHAAGDHSRVSEQLRAAKAWGVVLDTLNTELVEAVLKAELPTVMVNSWVEEADVDVVIQDNYRGGFLAAKHLVASGAKRVGWVGPVEKACHSRERHAGAVAGLGAGGLSMKPGDTVRLPDQDVDQKLKKLLGGPDRPDALLVFWKGAAAAVQSVAEELGLKIGTDLKLVGWCVEELYEPEHAGLFAGCEVPPAIVWKASDMAAAALERLEVMRKGGGLRRTCVPVRIKTSGG